MAYEVVRRTPLLVLCLAAGLLILLLGLAITEDKSFRRQVLQKARVRVLMSINQMKINQQKEIMEVRIGPTDR